MLLSNEYHSYFKIYIDPLLNNGKSIVDNLIDLDDELEKLINIVPHHKHLYVYAEGKWTFKELLLHIIDAERVFNYRAPRFARNDLIELEGFDHNYFNANASTNSINIEDFLIEFKSVRSCSISIFRSFS